MGVFDHKNFNSEVFAKYLETVPRVKQNALLNAGVLRTRQDLRNLLSDQTGGNFISVPMTGLIGGSVLNYDGSTDITATSLDTFLQSMIVVGRAKAWEEKDFSFDITGTDFMEKIGEQTANYWDDVDQSTLLSILTGMFGVTADNFSERHTLDLTGGTGDAAKVGATSLNSAIQKAAGANKNIFAVAIMHSEVATNLENMQVLEYFKENDANGIQRSTNLATWNGRVVLIDDDVPTANTYSKTTDTTKTAGKTYYTKSGDNYTEFTGASFTSGTDYYEVSGTTYTTYILGQGAFDYCDCGAKVASEIYRDPLKTGGKDMLITRQRHLYAPRGFSFVQPTTAIVSPTDAQLATAANWTVVKNTSNEYYNTRAIPFARILSKG